MIQKNTAQSTHRPTVIVNVAITKQGEMSKHSISNSLDWKRVHALRATSDGVAVGRITWNQDHPRLNARKEHLGWLPSNQPCPIVFSNLGEVEEVNPNLDHLPILIGPRQCPGFRYIKSNGVNLSEPLEVLADMGMRRILVEGGRTLVSSFLDEGVWDRFHVFVPTVDPVDARTAVSRAFDLNKCTELRCTALGTGVVLTYVQSNQLCYASYSAPTQYGLVRHHVFFDPKTAEELTVLEYGQALDFGKTPLVRIQSACFAGELAESRLCDCGPQFHNAIHRFSESGGGLLVYMHGHEGRGIGLLAKAEAYELKSRGLDTVDANLAVGASIEARCFDLAARALILLGLHKVILLTNNPLKLQFGKNTELEVVQEPFHTCVPDDCHGYLMTKIERMNHDPKLIAEHPFK